MASGVMGGSSFSGHRERLLGEIVPKVKEGLLSQKRTEGFRTEACDKVAERFMDAMELDVGVSARVVGQLLRDHYIKRVEGKGLVRLDELLYHALTGEFENRLKSASYNGTKGEYRHSDLFTRGRATAKAQLLAYQVTDRLLKGKRSEILSAIEREFRSACAMSGLGVASPGDLARDRGYLERVIKPLIVEEREEVVKAVDLLFIDRTLERRVDGGRVVKTPVVINKWEGMLGTCASMAVHFADLFSLGRASSRGEGDRMEVNPKKWVQLREGVLAVADPICLRGVVLRTIDPVFQLMREHGGGEFDDFHQIAEEVEAGRLDRAVELLGSWSLESSSVVGKSRCDLLLIFLEDMALCMNQMPSGLGVSDEDIEREYAKLSMTSSEAKRAQMSVELAPKLFLQSLSSVHRVMKSQYDRVMMAMERREKGI